MFSIVECNASDGDRWDKFVRSAHGTYNHLFGWKAVLERAYGLRPHYLVVHTGDTWLAVLPLAVMPRLPGRPVRAVSLPYCNYGGLLAAPGLDPAPLKTAALAHLAGLGIGRVEFRECAPGLTDSPEVTMLLALPETEELLWANIGAKARNQVRKAQQAGLTVQWGRDQGDILHEIYACNMGRLGTPVHSPRFIREILVQLGEAADVLTIRLKDCPIGAMLLVRQDTTWADPIASCLTEFNALSPNMLLYWEVLRRAAATGAKTFDFGRSRRDSGTHRFKKQWGATEVALNYHSYQDGELVPAASTHFYRGQPASALAQVWSRLPGFFQRGAGPVIRRWMP